MRRMMKRHSVRYIYMVTLSFYLSLSIYIYDTMRTLVDTHCIVYIDPMKIPNKIRIRCSLLLLVEEMILGSSDTSHDKLQR